MPLGFLCMWQFLLSWVLHLLSLSVAVDKPHTCQSLFALCQTVFRLHCWFCVMDVGSEQEKIMHPQDHSIVYKVSSTRGEF